MGPFKIKFWQFCIPAFRLFLLLLFSPLSGCTTSPDFQVENFAKTGIDEISDIHLDQATQILKELTIKLYKKNPCELTKVPNETILTRYETIFECPAQTLHEELNCKTGTHAILLGFDPLYSGDRVFAIMYGLYTMILQSYNNNCEMFMLDLLDQQKLYNSARNIEILVWRLKKRQKPDGTSYLLTDNLDGESPNLSYERLFGKLIALQDTMAVIVSRRTNRIIKKAAHIVGMAFLPVGL